MGINANNFRKYLKNFENISLIIDKPIPIEQTELNINDKAYMNGDLISGYNWWWTNPALSIILRGNNDAYIKNNTKYNYWEPKHITEQKNILGNYYKKSRLFD